MSVTIRSVDGRELYVAELATTVCAAVVEAVQAGAYLTGAYLAGAYLTRANLTRAKHAELVIARTRIIPDEGDIIGWKKARENRIVKLRTPHGAKRSHAMGRKCRSEQVEVLAIYNGDAEVHEAVSLYDSRFRYRVGETVTPTKPFDDDMWNECSTGIHWYLTRLEAEHHV